MGTAKTTKSAVRIHKQKHFKVNGPWMDLSIQKHILWFPHSQVMVKNFKNRFRTSDSISRALEGYALMVFYHKP